MRWFWLAALGVLAVVMAVFTPYVFRNESTWQAVAWCVMFVGTVGFIAGLMRMGRLIRALDRRTGNDTSET
jgi:MFS superfamily sulfate permease-like transporter